MSVDEISEQLAKAYIGKAQVYGIDERTRWHRISAVRVLHGKVQGKKVTGGWFALSDYASLKPSPDFPLSF